MPFVGWYYRNGTYVGSHYRRPPRRRWDSTTPPLFGAAGLGVTAGDQPQRTDAVAPATRALSGAAAGTVAPGSVPLDTVLTGDLFDALAI